MRETRKSGRMERPKLAERGMGRERCGVDTGAGELNDESEKLKRLKPSEKGERKDRKKIKE